MSEWWSPAGAVTDVDLIAKVQAIPLRQDSDDDWLFCGADGWPCCRPHAQIAALVNDRGWANGRHRDALVRVTAERDEARRQLRAADAGLEKWARMVGWTPDRGLKPLQEDFAVNLAATRALLHELGRAARKALASRDRIGILRRAVRRYRQWRAEIPGGVPGDSV